MVQEHKFATIPPWWRTDVVHPADLIEEVLSLHEYSHIPLEHLDSMPSTNNPDHVWEQEETMRHSPPLTRCGDPSNMLRRAKRGEDGRESGTCTPPLRPLALASLGLLSSPLRKSVRERAGAGGHKGPLPSSTPRPPLRNHFHHYG